MKWGGYANAYTIIAVYAGTTCNPYGQEVACIRWPSRTGTLIVDLEAGQSYLIQFYTDEQDSPMQDPVINITP